MWIRWISKPWLPGFTNGSRRLRRFGLSRPTHTFDVRNLFGSKPHTDVMIGPPGDQRPWMNDTDESQVLKCSSRRVVRTKRSTLRGGKSLTTAIQSRLRICVGRWLDGATDRDRHHHAHEGSRLYGRFELRPAPQPSHALFKKILRGPNNECRTVWLDTA
jgi:hypothetical protein